MSGCGFESCMPGSLSVLLAESNSSDKTCNHSPQTLHYLNPQTFTAIALPLHQQCYCHCQVTAEVAGKYVPHGSHKHHEDCHCS